MAILHFSDTNKVFSVLRRIKDQMGILGKPWPTIIVLMKENHLGKAIGRKIATRRMELHFDDWLP